MSIISIYTVDSTKWNDYCACVNTYVLNRRSETFFGVVPIFYSEELNTI